MHAKTKVMSERGTYTPHSDKPRPWWAAPLSVLAFADRHPGFVTVLIAAILALGFSVQSPRTRMSNLEAKSSLIEQQHAWMIRVIRIVALDACARFTPDEEMRYGIDCASVLRDPIPASVASPTHRP